MYLLFSFLFRYIVLVHEVLWPFIDIHCTYLFHLWLMYVFLSPTFSCVVFFFSLYTHASYYLYAIYYFCFTQKCLDEFCLKCFRNIGCQSLLATNSLAKFSRVCDRIDFIVFNKWIWVKWFMTSLICSFVCCSFVTDCQKGEIVRTYVFHMLGSYVSILCNWLILWQNALYL